MAAGLCRSVASSKRAGFIADLAPLSAVEDSGLLPGHRFLLADLFGSELLGGVEAASARLGSQTEPAAAAGTGHDLDAVQALTKIKRRKKKSLRAPAAKGFDSTGRLPRSGVSSDGSSGSTPPPRVSAPGEGRCAGPCRPVRSPRKPGPGGLRHDRILDIRTCGGSYVAAEIRATTRQ